MTSELRGGPINLSREDPRRGVVSSSIIMRLTLEKSTHERVRCVCVGGGGCASFLHFQNVAVYNLSNDPHLQLVGGEDDWCSGH